MNAKQYWHHQRRDSHRRPKGLYRGNPAADGKIATSATIPDDADINARRRQGYPLIDSTHLGVSEEGLGWEGRL